MADRVRITDVSPRDGLQNEPGVIPTADKVRLVELLSRTGVDEIEVTSFVSPKWVPQLGDGAEVLAELARVTVRSVHQGGLRAGYQTPSLAPALDEKTVQAAAQRRASEREWQVWDRVKSRQIHGVQFRRSHPFGEHIIAFYAPSARLAVELAKPGGRTAADRALAELLRQHDVELIVATERDVQGNLGGLIERIRTAVRRRVRPALPAPPRLDHPELSALVPNEKGMQGALAANAGAGFPIVEKVSVFTAASETFSQKNTNASINEAIERFKPVVAIAREHGLPVRAYISCVIACPFEGAIDPKEVALVAGKLERLGVDEIDLGDTIGAGTPESVVRMLRHVRERLEVVRIPPITLHLHDTFGRAAECVLAALEAGVRSFDASVAGLGGCPYASTPGNRAPGNISTETLVRTIHEAGYETGVDLDRLAQAATFAREIVARARAQT
jgi:hydroxymethylglutaryl-CoA lyase